MYDFLFFTLHELILEIEQNLWIIKIHSNGWDSGLSVICYVKEELSVFALGKS